MKALPIIVSSLSAHLDFAAEEDEELAVLLEYFSRKRTAWENFILHWHGVLTAE